MDIELTMTYAISTLNTYKNIHLRPLAHDILTQSLHLKDTITMARQRLTMAMKDPPFVVSKSAQPLLN